MDDLLADFLTETNEGLQALDGALLQLERSPGDRSVLSEVFRTVHTIKGTCGFLGLARLERVAHAAENVLGLWRDGTLAVTAGGITLILRAVDRIKEIVAGLAQSGQEPAGDDSGLIADLDAVASGQAPSEDQPSAPAEDMLDAGAAAAAAPADGASGGPAAPQTIRVAVEVLEDLMVLVSELVLTRNQLLQLARAEENAAFSGPLQRLSQITSDLQEGVMKTRMQPIGQAWQKLPRLVRDLGQELGKRIALEMRGAETELDRQVLELIRDPLTHMVRNSADHGLETPEARRAAGKPETGRVFLNAYHEGGHIVMEVGDDGRGLSTERIRQKALAQGLATEAELAGMGEREIHRFIFRAGFSTAAAVTSISGRGVGMDVVTTNIERIGGTVDLRSKEGRGTTFTVKIPLTLAIAAALIVEAGGERFAIPQASVLELVRVGEGGAEGEPRIERIRDTQVMRLRDRLLPLVPLAGLLRLGGEGAAGRFVVVAQAGGEMFGIVVDRVFDTEEIVVKPVAPILRHVTMFSGNTILGDGSVIMILDPNGIARASGLGAEGSGGGGEAQAAPQALRPAESGRTSLLLFRAGAGAPKAVPLGLVARLEDLEASRIERAGERLVVQYRGGLMPLVPLNPYAEAGARGSGRQAVLVFGDGERAMGLMVDEILDVVEQRLEMGGAGERPGFLGSCVVAGHVTDILDTAYWLRQGQEDWFTPRRATSTHRVLVVEDSAFFRNLVVPAVAAAGLEVVTVANGREALRLREAGEAFDLVVSDIEMPEMDGYALVRAMREGGPWAGLPVIALTGRSEPEAIARGREAGFTDYIGKFDRDALIASIRQCLGAPLGAAA